MAMKIRLHCVFFLLLCLLLLLLHVQVPAEAAHADHGGNSRGDTDSKISAGPRINCDFACSRRCMAASRQAFCKRACGTCCARCQCVPAGTYGNHNMCPCYASLTTHGRRPKCP